MKAKMPSSQKPQEPGQYECLWCDTVFWYQAAPGSKLACPSCRNADRRDLVPIYMENSPSEQTLYTAADWHGG
ncbi:MAG TPA: hypothetical protein V6D22_16730 [Candidatus Obscuribacterales bacterium]